MVFLIMQGTKIGLLLVTTDFSFFCLLSSPLSCQIKQLTNEYVHSSTIFALIYGAIYVEYVCSAILQLKSIGSQMQYFETPPLLP